MSSLHTAKAAPPEHTVWRTALALAILYFVWSSTYLSIKFAVETIPPFYLNALRFLIASSALYLALRLRGQPNAARRQWFSSGLVGGLLLIGGTGLTTLAEALGVSSSVAAVVIFTMPLCGSRSSFAFTETVSGGSSGRAWLSA